MTLRDDLEECMRDIASGEYSDKRAYSLLRDHGQALLEALDAKRAIEEQAMVTECVSVDGRDPSDVIRDIISWHFEMDGCRKDAERYRWLRDAGDTSSAVEDRFRIFESYFDEDLDAAIDAAMEGVPSGGG